MPLTSPDLQSEHLDYPRATRSLPWQSGANIVLMIDCLCNFTNSFFYSFAFLLRVIHRKFLLFLSLPQYQAYDIDCATKALGHKAYSFIQGCIQPPTSHKISGGTLPKRGQLQNWNIQILTTRWVQTWPLFWTRPTPSLPFWLFLSKTWKNSQKLVGQSVT